ncbi:helix-turn-helix domain-containing protein [Natronococcus sp. JC468]|uniref:helix-turn-helix domain-containing protein n=1 Tax=Natronococcus sp. JC468 TaxID=1961921 RepID=UPI00143C13B9|nr:helix-turn-helix domain-containing protein [Natronococcus sp. JC468]
MFIATFSVAVDDFALAHALREVPAMEVKAEQLAAHSRHWVMPCVWVVGDNFDAFDIALEDDPTVNKVVTEVEYNNEKFYQIDWAEEIQQHLDVALDSKASILDAETTNDDWWLTIRFGSRNQFNIFRDYLTDQEITFSLENLTQSQIPHQYMGGLTDPQREALVVAVEEGYFAIPREATMDEIADRLGISTQSASERLRRGIEEFVETMLVTDIDKIDV